jgi:glutamate-ammonia-ligase adenylyltransferase
MMTAPTGLPERLRAEADAKWERLRNAAEQRGVALAAQSGALAALRPVLAFSDFVADTCVQDPMVLADLDAGGDLVRRYAPGDYDRKLAAAVQGTADAEDLALRLRRFRRREMVRIAFRDLSGAADLTQTTADLTALAEACLETALARLFEWQCAESGAPVSGEGSPQRLVVLGLGKLGAGELNFSSDIDLIFAYPFAGETRGGVRPVPHEEFFTRLCRSLVHVIGSTGPQGGVFRVDLRLRPFGDSGPLVMSFDALERYYQEQGRDWERYAWIKARVVAGDRQAGGDLLRRLHPFVYRRYLDFGAFDSLRAMKRMISQEISRRGMQQDIKLGAGGIREIEFFGQIFQLIRGGVAPELQERSIRRVLAALAQAGHIAGNIQRELDSAYVFLRTLEHRLQEFDDRQTHRLPREPLAILRLAAAMGFADAAGFMAELERHRKAVHGHFEMLLEAGQSEGRDRSAEPQLEAVWQQSIGQSQAEERLKRIGFTAPAEALGLLEHLRNDPETRALSLAGRQRLDRLMPLVLLASAGAPHPQTALSRIVDIIRAIERRTSYLALLMEYPAALGHLVNLAGASPWIASFLAQHPVLLDELIDPRTLYRPPDRQSMAEELARRIGHAPADDLESQIEEICIFKNIQVLRVAAADVSGTLPLMRVSDYLSDIAETVIAAVVDLAWVHLTAKHGRPSARLDQTPCRRGFAVIAYGKLGGLELGYGSDLDLVFLHAGLSGQTSGGARPLDNAQFFNRLGQRIVHILTTHTRAGRVYDVDTRLRPSGISGILVRHIDTFREYQLHEAWTWEHQALIKARPVCGEPLLNAGFERIRADVLARRRDRSSLRREVIEMRARMRRERQRPDTGLFDLKQDAGGIVDIEFLIQYLALLHAHRQPELVRWTDTVRLIQTLIGSAVLGEVTAHILKHAYLIYRAAAHQLSLQEKPACVPLEKFSLLTQRIQRIWQSVFTAPPRQEPLK